jgi:hypothetical protein
LVVQPFAPRLDGKIPEKLIRLRTNRGNEVNALRKHVRDIATKLLEDSRNKELNESDIEGYVGSLQCSVNEVIKINSRTIKKYFQTLLEDKTIWAGLAGLCAMLTSSISPTTFASLGITAVATMGAEAVKAVSERKVLLDTSPTRFLYYLNRAVGRNRGDIAKHSFL